MLHATEPIPDLPPLERLHDTLARIVAFVREHSGTFYSLVRGVASGDTDVRAVVEEARRVQADRVIAVFLELGTPDSLMLRVALRSWIAFAEEVLVESAIGTDLPEADIVGFLERSARGVVDALSER